MAPGALDLRTTAMIYLSISVSNGSRGAAARKPGMDEAMLGEPMAVVMKALDFQRRQCFASSPPIGFVLPKPPPAQRGPACSTVLR